MSNANFPNGGGNTIGNITGVSGNSVAHNNQAGAGGQKPSVAGNGSPNGCKPPKAPEGSVPMPK